MTENPLAPPNREHTIRKAVLTVLLVFCVLLTGSVAARIIVRLRPEAKETGAESPPLTVRTITVRPTDYQHYLTGYGSVEALRSAVLASQVSGRVTELNEDLRVGSAVIEGTVLCRVDDSSYREEYDRRAAILEQTESDLPRLKEEIGNLEERIQVARLDLEISEQEVERQKELRSSGATAERTYDTAVSALQASRRIMLEIENMHQARKWELSRTENSIRTRRAELELARLDLERCQVRAPFTGTLAAREVEPGELVNPGTPLLRVIDFARVEIPIHLPASEVESLTVGKEARLKLRQEGGEEWSGTVTRISPEIDSLNRTVAVYIRVDNGDLSVPLLPGLLVEARIEGHFYPRTIVIPRTAMVDQYAFTLVDGRARRTRVGVVRAIGDDLIVGEGLTVGDMLINSSLELLHEGLRVEALDSGIAGRGDRSGAEHESAGSVAAGGSGRAPGGASYHASEPRTDRAGL